MIQFTAEILLHGDECCACKPLDVQIRLRMLVLDIIVDLKVVSPSYFCQLESWLRVELHRLCEFWNDLVAVCFLHRLEDYTRIVALSICLFK